MRKRSACFWQSRQPPPPRRATPPAVRGDWLCERCVRARRCSLATCQPPRGLSRRLQLVAKLRPTLASSRNLLSASCAAHSKLVANERIFSTRSLYDSTSTGALVPCSNGTSSSSSSNDNSNTGRRRRSSKRRIFALPQGSCARASQCF